MSELLVLLLVQADAVELVLAYPFIARTPQQLSHMDDMLQSAPTALGISEEQLLPAFVKHPDLFRYRSMDELVHKYHTLATLFNGRCRTAIGTIVRMRCNPQGNGLGGTRRLGLSSTQLLRLTYARYA